MAKAKQFSLLKEPRKNTKKWWVTKHSTYGRSLNYRKLARPFDSKKLAHVVFKARISGHTSLRKHEQNIKIILHNSAERYNVQIKSFSIQKDHLHVLIYTKYKEAYSRFLRLFSANVGRYYAKLFRSWGARKSKNIWVARPFTRLVSFKKRELNSVLNYIRRNSLEALGFISYIPRRHNINLFVKHWAYIT